MRYPLDNWVQTQGFGTDPDTYGQFGMKGHNGLDAGVAIGTPILAPEDGMVFISANGTKDQYTGNIVTGETIVIKGTYEHWLLHNSQRLVSEGRKVSQGQLIAYSGNTGFTTGPHCHWGVRPLNPDMNNGYRGFIDQTNFIEEEPMFNEGDRVTLNLKIYGSDKGFHKEMIGKDWKTAVETIYRSPDFIFEHFMNKGDVDNYFDLLLGRAPTQDDYNFHVGLVHKESFYNLMSRNDVKERLAAASAADPAIIALAAAIRGLK